MTVVPLLPDRTQAGVQPLTNTAGNLDAALCDFAAIAWIQKRIWTFRVTGIIALVGLVAGLLLSHDAMM